MFVPSSLIVIFLNFLLTNVECSAISYKVENRGSIQERKNRQTVDNSDSNSSNWMRQISKIKEDLLNIQAIIAKDEELHHNCMTGSQKSEKRHLMCAGSILSDRHVLTSATCIHEATHIRHNIKAPLAVVIAPLKPNLQVIRVDSYKVHPKHNAFPYNQEHTRHNIAIIKLACSITTEHLTRIVLPKAPYTEICSSDNCMVAILRNVGKTSIVIYDTRAKHIPLTVRKRRSIGMTEELQNDTTTEILPANIGEKLRETSKILEPLLLFDKKEDREILPKNNTKDEMDFSQIFKLMTIRAIEKKRRNLELGSNSGDVPFGKLGVTIPGKKTNFNFSPNKVINQQRKVLPSLEGISTTTNIADQYVFQGDSDQNYRQRLFSIRSSNGYHGCPQSGSPVMFEKTQAALVSISCDDRQSRVPWKYTDLYLNSEWITRIIGNWDSQNNVTDKTESGKINTNGCNTCIYNFFIDLTGSNDKTNCSDLNLDSNKIKMCASLNGRKMTNKQTSIPKKDDKNSRNLQLKKPTQQRGSRQYEISHKIKNKRNDKQKQKLGEKSSKILKTDFSIVSRDKKNLETNVIKDDKHLTKNDSKNLAKDSTNLPKNEATDVSKDYDKDLGRVLRMDFDQKFDKDFEKNFQDMFQQNFHRDFKNDFNRDYDGGFQNKFKKDYYVRNMEMPIGNRLRKQIEGNQGHATFKQNEHKNLSSSKVVQTTSPREMLEHNPLSKKLHNLQMVLTRIQKTIPEKNIEQVVLGSQRKNFPKKEISNSGQGVDYFRAEKMQPILDRQYAVFLSDRERAVNNHHNVRPGFNGYFP